MRLLLDTNIVVPALNDQAERLPLPIRHLLDQPGHEWFVSAVSAWEIAIKSRLGKLPLHTELNQIPVRVAELGMALLNIDFRHALALVEPEPNTRDPFDRLLLAQCAVEGMHLVTVDRALAAHPYAWR